MSCRYSLAVECLMRSLEDQWKDMEERQERKERKRRKEERGRREKGKERRERYWLCIVPVEKLGKQ